MRHVLLFFTDKAREDPLIMTLIRFNKNIYFLLNEINFLEMFVNNLKSMVI